MNNPSWIRDVRTTHGSLVVEECGSGETPVLLIHGNSSCRGVFQRQLDSPLSRRRRLVAFDLPGHGQSSDAPDPMRTYTLAGLADAAIELLERLGISEVVVLGWSLGGHIGIEMMQRFPGMKGLVITGTPPVRRGGMAEGFIASPQFGLAGRRSLSDEEGDRFASAMFGAPSEAFLQAAIRRADGRFRQILFQAAGGRDGSDQRRTVEERPIPLAVVNGAEDRLINLDYVDSISYANLWSARCHRLDGAGHAPFWHASLEFNALVERFVSDLAKARA
jgi:pimeloyl-ACP methyl ester carboxylesterase